MKKRTKRKIDRRESPEPNSPLTDAAFRGLMLSETPVTMFLQRRLLGLSRVFLFLRREPLKKSGKKIKFAVAPDTDL